MVYSERLGWALTILGVSGTLILPSLWPFTLGLIAIIIIVSVYLMWTKRKEKEQNGN